MAEPTEIHMRQSDAFSWYMERDPELRSTIVSVVRLDRPPDRDRLVARVDHLTRELPAFRQRVLEPPLRLATPRWTNDADFDLSWHLRWVHLESWDEVLEAARVAAMTAFDPAHPLWENTFVEGLPGGEAAAILKLHHSLTDGVGGMQMALLLFDLERDASTDDAGGPAPLPGEHLGPLDLLRDALSHDWHRMLELARQGVGAALPAARAAVTHPLQAATEVVETARSVARMVAPVNDTRSPVMTGRHLGRHVGTLDVPLGALHDAGAAVGGTLNDAFLAGVTGGLRRYHEAHGTEVGELRVTMPISIRKDSDPIGGNRITLQRFEVPAGEPDVVARMRGVHEACARARAERALPLTNAIAGTLNLLPRGYVGAMLKHVDFLASNVPGFSFPVYLAGAEVLANYAFGPTIGSSVNVTLLSHRDTCCIGVTIDTAAVPDPEVLLGCLEDGFAEVIAAAPAPSG
jgi:diacylglycerol O-acyltransferase / wax synthase